MLETIGIEDVPTRSQNPIAIVIYKCMHQMLRNILHPLLNTEPPVKMTATRAMVDTAHLTCIYSLQATNPTNIGGSSGALIFNCEIFENVPLVTDWHLIAQQQMQLVNENL